MTNKQQSGWGSAIALLLWAAILFLFGQWPGEPYAFMWMARVFALLSLLVGVLLACMEIGKEKKPRD